MMNIEMLRSELEQRGIVCNTATAEELKTLAQYEYEKTKFRSRAGLTLQLIDLEGKRVEVVTTYNETRRFWVGKSTGWIPCHLEIARIDSSVGVGCESEYKSVRVVRER